MIGNGNKIGDLYLFDVNNNNSALSSHSIVSINHVDVHIWHSRLGHLSDKRLNLLKDQLPCNVSKFHTHTPCYICPLAKQKTLSFVSNNHMSSFPFDLIHCDIWGPYNEPDYFDHRYFLTLVDDCTRFTWVFLFKCKSDVNTIIPKFFNMVLTQFDKRIKQFRSDNARELAFTEFFSNQGVIHQFYYVEKPQHNLVVDRKHQHLLNVAWALHFQSQVRLQFWSYCVLTATF